MTEDVWTVLASGPSLALLRPETFVPEGPVVALNNAAHSDLPFDFWCCQDPPRKFEAVYERMSQLERRRFALVWCRDTQTKHWHERGFRTWPHPRDEAGFRAKYLPGSRRVQTMVGLTVTTAISRCIGQGAKKVVVYGVDMNGTAHGFGPDPDKRALVVWHQRWKTERVNWERAVREWTALGVEIERKQPEENV